MDLAVAERTLRARRALRPDRRPEVFFRAASAGYPRVVGLPLVEGRWTTDGEAAPAVMVNETFVRRVFGNEEALGHRVHVNSEYATIVGVVGDLKTSRLDADPDPEVLIPLQRMPVFRRLDILVKAAGSPAAMIGGVRKAVQGLDPTQPPYGITTLEGALAESDRTAPVQPSAAGEFCGAVRWCWR